MNDARVLNWRFVVPEEPPGLLLLPIGDERVPGCVVLPPDGSLEEAVGEGTYPAVVMVDGGRWSRRFSVRPTYLLGALCDAVAPGGYLCAGFANPMNPTHPRARGSLGPSRIRRVLADRGLVPGPSYVVFPDLHEPAYLVARGDPACLDYFVRRLSIPYVAGRGRSARFKQLLLRVMRRIATVAPHAGRLAFAPATIVLARRPA